MVSGTILDVVLLAQQAERKVPEPTRTIVLMALLGILLVGVLLIAATMLGANWVRRQGGFRRRRVVPSDVILPRTMQGPPTASSSNASSADTFIGDDTVRNDDTIVS